MLPATEEGGNKRQRVEELVQTSAPLTIAAPVRTTEESSSSVGNREPNTSNDTRLRCYTQNGWFIKEDPNFKDFLLTLKDEINKTRNQGEKKKVVFISYAWEENGSKELENLQNFIKQLCSDLQLIGLHVFWDKPDIDGDMIEWMQRRIAESSHIIIIGTPLYRNKAYDSSTNVFKEFNHILARLKENHPPKLLPVLFSGNKGQSFPDEIQNIFYRDFGDPSKYLSSLIGLDPVGLIPGVFEELSFGGNLERTHITDQQLILTQFLQI